MVLADLLDLTPERLAAEGRPREHDVVVVVGNVMVYLADDTEVRVLAALRRLLVPGGRALVGFHPQQGPVLARPYPAAVFTAHVAEAGLDVEHVFGGYDLEPPGEDYLVAVLRRPGPPAVP